MSERTYRLNRFAFFDRERIQNYLEGMAKKGWMLDKTGATLWRYRKERPRNVHVSILYVADGSTYNPCPTAKEELLEDLSADNGWHLQARWGQMQIFYNEQPHPLPLETDPVTQVEAIRRCMKKNGIPTARFQIFNGLFLLGLMMLQLFTSPTNYLSKGFWVFLIPDSILIILMGMTSLISWHLWYRKATDAALEGRYISVWNARWVNLVLGGLTWLLLALMILSFNGKAGFLALCCLPVIVVAVFVKWLTKAMKESGVRGKTNFWVGIAASVAMALVMLALISFIGIQYHLTFPSKPVGTYLLYDLERDVFADEIPLRVEDLTDTAQMEWSTEERSEESFLLANRQYRQWPLTTEDVPRMDYQVLDSKAPFVYALCKNDLLRSRKVTVENGEVLFVNHFEPIDPAPWGALEAYQELWDDAFSSHYILCYENKIIKLHTNWELDEIQQSIVGRVLG